MSKTQPTPVFMSKTQPTPVFMSKTQPTPVFMFICKRWLKRSLVIRYTLTN